MSQLAAWRISASAAVTLAASPAFAAKWLLPRIDRFRAAYPHLDVRLDATDRLVDVASGDADIGVRYGGGSWPELLATHLLGEEVFPVCSPALLTGRSPLQKPADLARHTLIHVGDGMVEEPHRDIELGIDRLLGEAEGLLRGDFTGHRRYL